MKMMLHIFINANELLRCEAFGRSMMNSPYIVGEASLLRYQLTTLRATYGRQLSRAEASRHLFGS